MSKTSFHLSSRSLHPGQIIPSDHLYEGLGKNISPQLEWEGAPPGTKSFALTVFDPDAHTADGWWHWAVVNIPEEVHAIEEGASNKGLLPENAIELVTDFEERKYGGPFPPARDKPHRYQFTVYALKTHGLNVKSNTKAKSLKKILDKESLAQASFTVKYGRS